MISTNKEDALMMFATYSLLTSIGLGLSAYGHYVKEDFEKAVSTQAIQNYPDRDEVNRICVATHLRTSDRIINELSRNVSVSLNAADQDKIGVCVDKAIRSNIFNKSAENTRLVALGNGSGSAVSTSISGLGALFNLMGLLLLAGKKTTASRFTRTFG